MMVQFLVLLMALTLKLGKGHQYYNISEAKGDVILEYKGDYLLYTESWTAIHTVNVSTALARNRRLQFFLNVVSARCNSTSSCIHKTSIQLLQQQLNRMKTKTSYLNILSRNKRGLINFFGSGLKFLFGTLTESDAERINSEILEAYKNENVIHQLMHNQTIIVKNALKVQDKNSVVLRNNIAKIKKLSEETISKLNSTDFNEQIVELILQLEFSINSQEILVHSLLDAIFLIKRGLISPSLIPAKVIIESFKNISSNHPFTILPVDLEEKNIIALLKMSDIQAWLANQILVIKIDFHIPSMDTYTAYIPRPIPRPKGYGTFSALLLTDSILLLDKSKTIYTVIPSSEECLCLRDMQLCERAHPDRDIRDSHGCTIDLLKNSTKTCSISIFKLSETYVKTLTLENKWILIPNNFQDFLVIECLPHFFEKISLTVYTPYMLKLAPGCTGRYDNYHFTPFNRIVSNRTEILQVPYDSEIEITNVTHISIPVIKLENILDNPHIHELDNVREKISKLKELKITQTWSEKFLKILNIIGYISISIIMCYIFYKIRVWKLFTTSCPNICVRITPNVNINTATPIHQNVPLVEVERPTPPSNSETTSLKKKTRSKPRVFI